MGWCITFDNEKAWNLVCCGNMEIIFHYWLFKFSGHCIPTLIEVFIFFQPLKMNWKINLMLLCLMRETGKKKGVQANLSSYLRFQLKHATPFRWKALLSQVTSVHWLHWYNGTWNIPVNSLSVMFFERYTKTIHMIFFFYSLASICSFGSQKNQ